MKAGVDRDVALDGAGRVLRCEKCRNVTSSVAQTCRVLPRSLGDLEGTLAPAQFDAKEMLPMSPAGRRQHLNERGLMPILNMAIDTGLAAQLK